MLLELTIQRDGSVGRVRILEGAEPFVTASVTAARAWRFEPARKDGVPVAARVRFELRFPAPPLPKNPYEKIDEGEQRSEEAADETQGGPPQKEEPQEIVVVGARPRASVQTLTRAEVRQLPGAFGDPFRAIEMLPGVTPLISGVPFFFVRGAPPGNVGYFLDGVRVPLLYHIALGPSVVHPGIVERVDLYSGSYPARYGAFAGGIVAGETTPPRTDLHGEANVRVVDAGALVESGFDEGKGTVLAGGRYSYTGLIISLFAPETILRYWDYQLRASYDVSLDDKLTVFSFGAFDFLAEKNGGQTEPLFGTEFHRIDLRWDRQLDHRTRTRLAVTAGVDRTQGSEKQFVRDRMVGARLQVEQETNPQMHWFSGFDVLADFYDLDLGEIDADDEDRETLEELFPEREDLRVGAHTELRWKPEPWVTFTPGLRADLYVSQSRAAVGVEPRLAARFQVHEKWALLHSLGVAHQPPAFVLPLPGFQVSNLEDGLQRSVQSSAGVETQLPYDITGTATLFHNIFFNMTDALGTASSEETDEDTDSDTLTRRSLGQAYGVELLLKRRLTRKLGGFLSYTVSRSTRAVGSREFPARFDRTHVLSAALKLDLKKRWRFGTRFTYYTGFPIEEDSVVPENPRRVPSFFRLDWRLEKRWPLGDHGGYWSFVFEVLNTTLNKEVVDRTCSAGACADEEIGPVTVPSIGLEAFF